MRKLLIASLVSLMLLGLLVAGAVQVWAAGASLSGGAVDPTSGDAATEFAYSVTYTNPDGTAPRGVAAIIDQRRPLPLQPQGTDFASGVKFQAAARLPAGSHTFRFVAVVGRTELLFPGPARSDTLSGPDVAKAQSYVAGAVLDGRKNGVAGVTVKALKRDRSEAASATTDADGKYKIEGLDEGTYGVVAQLDGYRIKPPAQMVRVPPSRDEVNFVAVKKVPSYIAGVVADRDRNGVAGVAVKAIKRDRSEAGSATTDADGKYRIDGLADGIYGVVAQLDGYRIAPRARMVPVPPSRDDVNFLAVKKTPSSISGVVRDHQRNGVAGVTVSVNKGDTEVGGAVTDADGKYQVDGLEDGRYMVVPAKTDYRFLPRSQAVVVPPSRKNVSFLAIALAKGGLSDGSVDPTVGTPATNFTYKVTYTNSLNQPPNAAMVVIDGEKGRRGGKTGRMVKADPTDKDFTDGCVYTYQTTLPVGEHTFRFVFQSGPQIWRWPGPTMKDSQAGPTVDSQ